MSTQGPKKLTIEEYKKRLLQQKEERLTAIPVTKKPKHKRGGKLVKLRTKVAVLKALLAEATPSWDQGTNIWEQIDKVEAELKAHKNRQKSTK